MRIENTVEVDAPLDRVWALVNDIPRVAPCMPGAALTGVLDDDTYEGTVAVKLGPLRMSYKGKVVVEGVDEANHSARLAATGKDTKGAGTARASVETRLEAVGDNHTRLHGHQRRPAHRQGRLLRPRRRHQRRRHPPLRPVRRLPARHPRGRAVRRRRPRAGDRGSRAPPSGSRPGPPPRQSGTPARHTPRGGDPADVHGQPRRGQAPTAPPASSTAGPPSGSGRRSGDDQRGGAAAHPRRPRPGARGTPAPRSVEALDAGSLVGTVIKGRLTALFQAIAGFFRRLFGRRSTG